MNALSTTEPRPGLVHWGPIVLGVLLVLVTAGSYWAKTRPAPGETIDASSHEALMKGGLDALGRGDPSAAVELFKKLLALNPTHYGGTYQVARALDRAGRLGEARQYWLKMLALAESARDAETLATIRARLERHDVESEDDLMRVGLDALYARNDPSGAAVQFRKVREMNPAHYGATFQLAMALDRAGKPIEARPLWEKALKMAEGYDDRKTAQAAKERLARPDAAPSQVPAHDTLMKAGLDALYLQKDPGAAAIHFRKVLELSPRHYGATYQLAVALDRADKRAEAQPFWETVAAMAEGYNDKKALASARAHGSRRNPDSR